MTCRHDTADRAGHLVPGAGAVLLGVRGSIVVGVVRSGSTVLGPTGHAVLAGRAYPVLVGATLMILLQDQFSSPRHRRLRPWLSSMRPAEQGLVLLYLLDLCVVIVLVAALLTWGEALLQRTLVMCVLRQRDALLGTCRPNMMVLMNCICNMHDIGRSATAFASCASVA